MPSNGIRKKIEMTVMPTKTKCMTPGNLDLAPTGSMGKMLLENKCLIPTA
jgi:hypothetical protein